MADARKTKKQLLAELEAARQQIAELMVFQAEPEQAAALRGSSEAQSRLVLDSLGDPMHVVDKNLRFVLGNEAWTRWMEKLGLDVEVIGRELFEVYPFLPERVRQEYQTVIERGEVLITEETTTVGDQRFVTETRKIPVFSNGEVIQVITVVRDITQRKRFEESLARERALLRTLIDALPHFIFVKDTEGRFLMVNAMGIKRRGAAALEEVLGKTDYDFVERKLADHYRLQERAILQSGEPLVNHEEFVILTDTDEKRWFITTKVPFRDGDGNIAGLVAISRDITERKQAEEALEKRNRALEALHECALEIAMPLEVPTVLNRILARAEDLLAADRGGGIAVYDEKENVLRLVEGSGVNRDRVGLTMRPGEGVAGRVLQTRKPFIIGDYTHWENRATTFETDPSPSTIMGVPLLVHDQVIGVLLLVADAGHRAFDQADVQLAEMFAAQAAVTLRNARLYAAAQQEIAERQRAEEALSASEKRFRALIEQSADIIAMLDAETKLLYLSPTVRRVLGYAETEVLSLAAFDFLHPDDLGRAESLLAELLRRPGEITTGEFRVRHQEGSWRWFEGTGTNLLGEPDVQAIVGNLRDITERKQAEETLRASEERYRALFESAPVGIVLSVIGGRVVATNPAFEQMLGYSAAELNQAELASIYQYPEERARFLELIRTEGSVRDFEVSFRRKDGSAFSASSTVVPFPLAGEKIFLSMITDITERQRAEAALRESEERYRLISEVTSDYAFVDWVEPDGAFANEWVTDAALRITGLTREEWKSPEAWQRTLHPEDRPAVLGRRPQILSGQPDTSEYRVIRPDGEVRWIRRSMYPVWDEQEKRVVRIYGAGKDITEQKQAEVALRESHQLQAMAQQLARVGSLEWDLRTNHMRWSDELYAIFGLNPKSYPGGVPFDTALQSIYPDDRPLMLEATQKATQDTAETGPSTSVECRILRGDGTVRTVLSEGRVLCDESGKPARVIGMVQDITERKQAGRQALELALERERINILSQFVQDASHEFRTPLSMINLSVHSIRRSDDPLMQARRLKNIESLVQKITKLVDDLVTMSRLDSGVALEMKTLDLREVVEQALSALQSQISGARLEAVFAGGPGEKLPVQGNLDLLHQAIGHILDNAVRYTPAGGTITLRAGRRDDEVLVEIADTGIGMSAAVLARIFERFYRVDVAHTTSGFGLGLPIAQKIVAEHGGRIEVASEEGQGSTFRILLPASA